MQLVWSYDCAAAIWIDYEVADAAFGLKYVHTCRCLAPSCGTPLKAVLCPPVPCAILQGLGVPRKSVSKAFMHFVKAAQAGHSQAMYNAAMMQLAGQGTQRSCKPAVVYLKLLAEKGMVAAEVQQAHEYFFKGQYAQVGG